MRGALVSRFVLRILLAYAVCRVITGVILVIVAARQVPTGWTGPVVSYLTFTAQWDGQWYQAIAEHGYPRTLPVDGTGLVRQNPWAFYPLFPLLSRVFMELSGQSFYVVGSSLSLVLGFVAAAAMAVLLRERIGERATLAVVVLWASFPAAAALQVGYSEATAMALLTLYLLALSRERWWWATTLAVLIGLARPIAAPLAVVTLVALWMRWRNRGERPIRVPEGIAAVAALAGCGLAGLLWPTVAWAVTGQRNAYPETMAAWRGSHEIVPVAPWLDMSRFFFGQTWGPVWLTAGFTLVLVMASGPWAARLGPQLRAWALAYPAYLFVVLDPYTSIYRYLIPLFPLLVVMLGVGSVRRRASLRWLRELRAVVLFVAFVIGQWYWIDILWRFIPPTDYPP